MATATNIWIDETVVTKIISPLKLLSFSSVRDTNSVKIILSG